MSNRVSLVVTAIPRPDDMEAVQGYLSGVMPLLVQAGGSLVKRMRVRESINGTPQGMVLLMDFDGEEQIRELFSSEEYTALIPMRDRGFAEMNISIAEAL